MCLLCGLQDGSSPQEALESYCQELESTAAWGGQLELGVLAEVGTEAIHT
jgi:hypothetical protein